MDDRDIIGHIDELVAEEHKLEGEAREGRGLTDPERARLAEIEVQLDQCWDLLRRRRARRSAGEDPDDLDVRDAETVEHYRQ